MPFTAKYVANQLGNHFNTRLSFTEADDCVDGEVTIDKFLSVQVGYDYLILTEVLNNNHVKMFPNRTNIKDIITDITKIQM